MVTASALRMRAKISWKFATVGPLTTARPYSFGVHRAWRGASAPTYGSPGSIDWPHASQVGRIPGWGRMKGLGVVRAKGSGIRTAMMPGFDFCPGRKGQTV